MLMLTNVGHIEDLGSLARANARGYDTKTVSPSAVEEHEALGWTVSRKSNKSVRLTRVKSHAVLLEDRVWMLLYRMKFRYLSGPRGAQLKINPGDNSPQSQIDVVGIDDEVAIAIESPALSVTPRRSCSQ
jgi:DNA sulfur modification protein DndB